jgi:UDP-2,4-diacetamido-2,4,6-trideoxy-beta-L-altropyranose hydrolase
MSTYLFRADADCKIGTGHIMRMLGLAQYWHDLGEKVMFVSHCEIPDMRKRILDMGINLIDIGDPTEGSAATDGLLLEADQAVTDEPDFIPWVIMDGYRFTTKDQKTVKDRGYPLMFVDDFGHASHYFADIVLNQNLSADSSLYVSREPYTELLLGAEYAVLRKEFRNDSGFRRDIPAVAKKILVTLGGADFNNVTEKVVRAFNRVKIPGMEARVLIGPANPNLEKVRLAAASSNFPCCIITNPNMSEELKWADMAVVGGGITCLEVAFMGLPAITVVIAENQKEAAEKLAESGVIFNLGWHYGLSKADLAGKMESLMRDADLRRQFSYEGKKLVDGDGVKRIARKIMAHSVRIRPAENSDCELIWKWANESEARSVSFNSDYISWQDHVKWFSSRLQRDDIKFYIITTDRGISIGQARFEPDNENTVISVSVDPAFRGRGLGSVLISKACRQFRYDSDRSNINAYIKLDNWVSRQAFGNAGFREIGMTEVKGHNTVIMQYQLRKS